MVHIAAASGSSISTARLAPDADELRRALTEVGAPIGGPMQVLHAYRLHNGRLLDEFNKLASEGVTLPVKSLARQTTATAPGCSSEPPAAAPKPQPVGYRLLAMRLPSSAVEHVLVHGLNPKLSVDAPLDWQVRHILSTTSPCSRSTSTAPTLRPLTSDLWPLASDL